MIRPISYEDIDQVAQRGTGGGETVEGAVLDVDGGMVRLTLYKDDGTTVVIEEDERE